MGKSVRVTPPPAINEFRDTLEQIADAGMIDSSIEYAKELVDKVVAADPAKDPTRVDLKKSVNELEPMALLS